MNVFSLSTCRSPELLQMTLLVFDSIRTGFPTANIKVIGNNLPDYAAERVKEACTKTECQFENGPETIHHEFISDLIQREQAPFWLVDGDVIFYGNTEKWSFDYLAGARIQEWQDEFSGAVTRARLHTSLLYIDPVQVREKVANFRRECPDTPFTPFANLLNPICLPFKGRMYFHDTASLLYHAIGGQAFSDRQKDAYFHFNFGTIPDLVMPRLKDNEGMAEARDKVLKNPELGRGMWRVQEEYFAVRPPQLSLQPLPPPDPSHAEEAQKWNHALCKGNQAAMQFNDLWYNYCHGIDDLIDTLEDGRPTLSKEAILQIFATAAVLYNSVFYKEHQQLLFPIVLSVTNQFADSVAWEKSPLFRRRVMADTLRTCGNEMYHMIAIICGGWTHVRAMSPLIRDRDWLGQHDSKGNAESITYG